MVNDFTVDDIDVVNATTSDFSGAGARYTVTVTPTSDGEVTVSIPAGAVTDNAGHNNTASSALARPANLPSAPSAPRDLALTTGDTLLVAEWSAPADEGGQGGDLTSYLVEWRSGLTDPWSSETLSPTTRAYVITGLTNNSVYSVRITAVNAVGSSDPSTVEEGQPTADDSAPRITGVRESPRQLRPRWSAPTNIGSNTLTSYVIQWRKVGESFDDTRRHTQTDLTDLEYHINGLDNGVDYIIRVSALSNDTVLGSAVTTSAPASPDEIIERVVEKYEGDFPWLGQAWRNAPISAVLETSGHPAYHRSGTITHDSFRVTVGISYGFLRNSLHNRGPIEHELAHHFTLDHRVPGCPRSCGCRLDLHEPQSPRRLPGA